MQQSLARTRPGVLLGQRLPLRCPVPDARPGENLQPSRMTEGRVEEAASACFGTITSRLQRLFHRLPKGHWGSLKPQALPGLRPDARLARGRSRSLQLGVFRAAGPD